MFDAEDHHISGPIYRQAYASVLNPCITMEYLVNRRFLKRSILFLQLAYLRQQVCSINLS